MLKRRDFLRKCGHAATLLPGAAASGALPEAPDPRLYHEPARDVPIEEPVDVVVCGAGPAGVSAAIAAGRMGAKVRLIDVNGCLGGIWTAGLLCWILDAQDKPGLMRELTERLDARGALFRASKLAYDPEVMKLLLEELCLDAGVKIRLHTRVVAAVRDDSNRLSLAVTESKSGRQAFGGSVFVDATGDGDLAAIGDRDCDGTSTIAVLRPEDGTVRVFDRWALDGRPAQAATWGRVDGAATIAAPADGCGAPRVTTTAGAVQTVTPTGSSDATPAGERP